MRRNPTVFRPDTHWYGGFYELAIELGPRSDERLFTAHRAVWTHPQITGPYLTRNVEPEQQSVIPLSPELVIERHLYGVATLSENVQVPMGTYVIREDDGPDWLDVYLPMGGLAEHFSVGAHPFGSDNEQSWREPLDAWLAALGDGVFRHVPFDLALIGWEVSGETYASELRGQVPAERYFGYLVRTGSDLVSYPPNRWGE